MLVKTEIDITDLDKKLGKHRDQINRIAKRCMSKVLQEVRKQAKANTKGMLKKRSGNLLKSMKIYSFKDFTGFIQVGGKVDGWYGAVHERTPITILPKKGEFLYFQINGEWKRAKSVTLPKRQFALPAFENVMTNQATGIIENTLQVELDKIYEKENT